MVVFLVATILITTAALTPSVLLQGRRDREDEMIWRGLQYQRAIGLYFRKFGRYPTKIEDLTSQTNGMRFLRQAFPDPMNKEDGSWRYICAGPNGTLLNSLTRTSLMQIGPTNPAAAGTSPFSLGAQPGASSGIAGGPGQSSPAPNSLEAQPQPLGGTIIGCNIIGVGSKVKEASLRIYQGGDRYELWEFIWNPNQGGAAIPTQVQPNQLTPGTTAPAPTPGPPTPGLPPATSP